MDRLGPRARIGGGAERGPNRFRRPQVKQRGCRPCAVARSRVRGARLVAVPCRVALYGGRGSAQPNDRAVTVCREREPGKKLGELPRVRVADEIGKHFGLGGSVLDEDARGVGTAVAFVLLATGQGAQLRHEGAPRGVEEIDPLRAKEPVLGQKRIDNLRCDVVPLRRGWIEPGQRAGCPKATARLRRRIARRPPQWVEHISTMGAQLLADDPHLVGASVQQGRDERLRVGAVPVDERQRGVQSLRAGPCGIARDGVESARGPAPKRAKLADDRGHMSDLGGTEPFDERPGLE